MIITSYENSNSQIATEWVNRIDYGFFDSGNVVKTDQDNNIYVLGTKIGSDNISDIVLIKYSSSGNLQWSEFYDGPDQQNDNASFMALDSFGNIYVVGSSIGLTSGRDGILLKYNSEGSLMWNKRYTSPGNHNDAISGISCNSGNVFVTGFSYGGPTVDCIVLKYDINGNELWNTRYTVGSGSTIGYNISDDKNGNCYVIGRCNADAMTLKFDTQGNIQWARFYNGPGNGEDVVSWILLDSAMNVYAAGTSAGNNNSFQDFLILKYNNSGDSLWTIIYNGSGQFDDGIGSMVFDNSGNILVTGQSLETGQGYNFTTIKYSQNGDEIWKAFYNNGPNDFGRSIAVDSEDNVYITGFSDGNGEGTKFDYATIKYDSAGQEQWAMRYDFSAQYDDQAYSIALDNNANVYVTGRSNRDIVTIKYSIPTLISTQLGLTPDVYSLVQNYPNPFNPRTIIKYQLNKSGNVKIKVYDNSGKLIEKLVDLHQNPGSYETFFDGKDYASGMYLYTMEIDGVIRDTKKMTLLK